MNIHPNNHTGYEILSLFYNSSCSTRAHNDIKTAKKETFSLSVRTLKRQRAFTGAVIGGYWSL